MNHFDETAAFLFVEGEMDALQAKAVEAHASECGVCGALLQALQKEDLWLRESLNAEQESFPARLMLEQKRSAPAWGWVAAAGMGIAGAYTLWSLVDPWIGSAAQAGFSQASLLTGLFFEGAFWEGWTTMLNFMEIAAVITAGAALIWVLRREWARFTTVASVLGAVALALALPASSRAAEVRHGTPNFTLPVGQEVKTDLIVAANRTLINGDVDGDLIVWSRSITVNGHIRGDILAFGRELRVDGPVDGNIRAWGESLTLNAAVGKNVMGWVGDIELDPKARVGGTMTLATRNAQLDGQIQGDLLAAAADLNINGSLGHGAKIRGDRVSIGSGAEIQGPVEYIGRRRPDVSRSAKLAMPIEIRAPSARLGYSSPRYYWRQFLFWGSSLAFGIVLINLTPRFFSDVVGASRRIGSSIGLGLLLLLTIPFAALIACFTIVGLSVGIATLFVYVITLYAAQVFVGAWLGEKLLGTAAEIGPAIGRLALGLMILRVLRIIPFAGPLIGILVVMWGLGAIALTVYRRMQPASTVAA